MRKKNRATSVYLKWGYTFWQLFILPQKNMYPLITRLEGIYKLNAVHLIDSYEILTTHRVQPNNNCTRKKNFPDECPSCS